MVTLEEIEHIETQEALVAVVTIKEVITKAIKLVDINLQNLLLLKDLLEVQEVIQLLLEALVIILHLLEEALIGALQVAEVQEVDVDKFNQLY